LKLRVCLSIATRGEQKHMRWNHKRKRYRRCKKYKFKRRVRIQVGDNSQSETSVTRDGYLKLILPRHAAQNPKP